MYTYIKLYICVCVCIHTYIFFSWRSAIMGHQMVDLPLISPYYIQ